MKKRLNNGKLNTLLTIAQLEDVGKYCVYFSVDHPFSYH